MDAELAPEDGAEREVHLYLTDYRSLYVGHVGEITSADIGSDEDERDHVPAFYRTAKLSTATAGSGCSTSVA